MRQLTPLSSCSFSTGGVSRLWLADWVPYLELNLSLTSKGLIMEVATAVPWIEFSVEGSRVLINQEKVDTKHGLMLRDRFQAYFAKQEATKWAQVRQQLSGRLMALYRDGNGLYFLAGWETGFTVDDFAGATGVKAEANGYALTYSSLSTNPVLEVAAAYITGVVEAPTECDYLINLTDSTPVFADQTCIIDGIN